MAPWPRFSVSVQLDTYLCCKKKKIRISNIFTPRHADPLEGPLHFYYSLSSITDKTFYEQVLIIIEPLGSWARPSIYPQLRIRFMMEDLYLQRTLHEVSFSAYHLNLSPDHYAFMILIVTASFAKTNTTTIQLGPSEDFDVDHSTFLPWEFIST